MDSLPDNAKNIFLHLKILLVQKFLVSRLVLKETILF